MKKLVKESLNEYFSEDENWTLSPGDRVLFDITGMEETWMEDDPESAKIALSHNGEEATIISPEVATEIGDRDFEYYNIKFDDGEELEGVSGYHLDDI